MTATAPTNAELNVRLMGLEATVGEIKDAVKSMAQADANRGRFTGAEARGWAGVLFGGFSVCAVLLALFIRSETSPMATQLAQVVTQQEALLGKLSKLDDTASQHETRISAAEGQSALSERDRGEIRADIRSIQEAELERERRLSALERQAAAGETSRQELSARIDRVSGALSDLREAVAWVQAALVEIETQFRGVGEIINLIKARFQLEIGRLWRKVFDQDYGDDDYAPKIGRDLRPQQ